MSEMKRLSVDDILDDIKRKKSGEQADSSAPAVDVDKLIAEIMTDNREKAARPEPDSAPPAAETAKPAPPSPAENPKPEPKIERPPEKSKEKFTLQIDFDREPPEASPKPKSKSGQAENGVSTVELLAESAAGLRGTAVSRREESPKNEPEEQLLPKPDPVLKESDALSEPTRYIDGDGYFRKPASDGEEASLSPDPHAFEAVKEPASEASDDVGEEYLEYRRPEDEREVYTEILSTRSKLLLRIVLLAVFGGAALALTVLQEFFPQLLPSVLRKAEQPLFYLVIQFVLQASCLLTCCSMIGEGLAAVVKLRANKDSLPALAGLAGLIQTVVCFFQVGSVNDAAVHLYTPVIAAILLCSCGAKLMMVNRMILNFRVVTSPYEKYTTALIEDEDAALELTRGSVTDVPMVAVQRKTGFVSDFVAYSTDEDASDSYARFLAPIGFGFAVLLGVAAGVMGASLPAAFTTVSAVTCMFAPFSYLYMVQMPMSRAVKKYSRTGGVILSSGELEDFSYTNAAVVTAHDLFPGNAVKLYGIKTFAGQRIDEALMDAASVVQESGSVLMNVFAQITGGDEKLLRPVDSLVYEDGMGISAWVDNKRVLIGSRDLMINHGISVPSRDYEERYLNEGHDLIYLSTSGELTAVFLVRFFAAPEVSEAIRRLRNNGIHLVIKSVDAVITRQKMAEVFDEDQSCFKILPSRLHAVYDRYSSSREKGGSSVLSNGTFRAFTGSLIGAKRLRMSILLGSIIQFAAVFLGLAMLIVLTLISGMSEMKVLSLFLYHTIWLAATWLLPRLKSI
ncbi:MAG: hypothetical protein HFJ85_06215 [Oscillospiraceae bacterium]|nr:hypothetical protein [Oscillospiraceae bacterium]